MQEVNGFAATLSDSIDLDDAMRLMSYRSWKGQAVRHNGNTSLGLCLVDTTKEDFSAIHGEFYGRSAERISELDFDDMTTLLAEYDGSYAFVLPRDNKLIFARDQLGTKPLYYSKSSAGAGVSSDARVLEQLLGRTEAAEPGMLYMATADSVTKKTFNTLKDGVRKLQKTEALRDVMKLLDGSVRNRVRDRKVVLGFSGIDSAILAVLASRYAKVMPVTVCTRDSADHRTCEDAAAKLDLPLEMILVDEKLIKNTLQGLREVTQLRNAMHASIACVVYLLAKYTKKSSMDALVLGQLADELFGGYARYARFFRQSAEKFQDATFNDVKDAHKENFERDEAAASSFTRLILPYASLPLARYAVNIPAGMKADGKGSRKIILRELAREIGIDEQIANKEKKAMHFSSGVFKIMSKLL